jgi:hypothetical protein
MAMFFPWFDFRRKYMRRACSRRSLSGGLYRANRLAYVYGHADPRDAETAKGLTLDEARRIAVNIAKLPTLLGSMLPDDAVNNLSDERHAAEDTTPE